MDEFEMNDFNVKTFITCAEELLRADETERALWVLDNLPAYYRDNTPTEILELRNEVIKRIATPTLYANGDIEDMVDFANGHGMTDSLRGSIIKKEVEWFNKQGLQPHVIDYGPGEYWLPIILKKAGLKFSYEPIFLNIRAHEKIAPFLKDLEPYIEGSPRVFVACEIIEHLWNEQDIKSEMLSHGGFADIIHVSTPCYTYDISCTDWKQKSDLGHLRAYTPKEFRLKLETMFREYGQFFILSKVMHARLTNANSTVPGLAGRWNVEYENL